MKELKVLIVDDERSARELITNLLADVENIYICGEADSVESAFREVIRLDPDVILLDIQMPRQDGFVLIEQLQELKLRPEIIFITAFDKYAIKAIKASAFDYLLKPVKKKELELSLHKLAKKVESNDAKDTFEQLIYQLSDSKKLKFKNRTGFYMVDPDEVLFCMADSNYTVLVLNSGKSYTISMNLGKVEKILPPHIFLRISRSAIINITYLGMVNRKNMTCELSGGSGHILTISRKYIKELENRCDKHFR